MSLFEPRLPEPGAKSNSPSSLSIPESLRGLVVIALLDEEEDEEEKEEEEEEEEEEEGGRGEELLAV